MFTTFVEYDMILNEINDYELSELQKKVLLRIITENPTIDVDHLLEIIDGLSNDEDIVLIDKTYSIDPILNETETETSNLLNFAIPAILKHIPNDIIGYMTESHARVIVDKIFEIEFDETTTPTQLHKRIDELFSAGDISIPIQGLRQKPLSMEVVMHGIFTQMLHKGIQFNKPFYSKHSSTKSQSHNKNTLRNALKSFNMIGMDESPLTKLLPKFIVVLNNLLGGKNVR